MNSEGGQVYSVCILKFSCFTMYNRMQSKHKQTKCEHSRRNSYSFLSRYHYNKSKNHLIRRYRIRHWIPMFIGTPCTYPSFLLYSHPSIVLTCSILIGQYFLSTLFLSFNTSNSPLLILPFLSDRKICVPRLFLFVLHTFPLFSYFIPKLQPVG